MDKIISFIIPSYNVEQYLEKCLSSFLNPQAIEQMEVIIVDDQATKTLQLEQAK